MDNLEENSTLHGNYSNLTKIKSIYSFAAYINFVVFLFFIFFGTKMPFGEKLKDVEVIATSNIINQVAFTFIFLTACFSLIPKWSEFVMLIKREKFLTIFLLWGLLTISWSDYGFVSFKRYFQYITTFLVSASIFFHLDSSEDTLKFFKYLSAAFIILSLLSIFTIPGAQDRGGNWKGLAPHKNLLGPISLLTLIIMIYQFIRSNLKGRIIYGLLVVISLMLIIGCKSSTTLFTLLFIIGILLALYLDKLFEPIGLGKTISLLTIFTISGLAIFIIISAPEILSDVFGKTGKDVTLTGRTDLWADIWIEISKHFWLGCGFQGYWVVNSPHIEELYAIYVWIPIQAHNGYLDVLNEVGMIGLTLFIVTIFNYFLNARKLKGAHIWKWFVIVAIVFNITESSFIRPRMTIGVMFMFSYIALFADLIKHETVQRFKTRASLLK